jgi:hypothetical protein
MRHARDGALDQLEGLLADLRTMPGLNEKTRGIFYRGSQAFLHFHEDPTGLYADVRLDVDFERMRVTSAQEQKALLTRVRHTLG